MGKGNKDTLVTNNTKMQVTVVLDKDSLSFAEQIRLIGQFVCSSPLEGNPRTPGQFLENLYIGAVNPGA